MRPRSITAWFQSPGASRGSHRAAAAATSAAETSSGSRPNATLAITLRTFVSTAATGTPNAIDATADAVYGPMPGSASNAGMSDGTSPPRSRTMERAASCKDAARRA